MDKAYTNSAVQHQWTKNNISWVTRLRQRANIEVLQTYHVAEQSQKLGIVSDQKIRKGRASNKPTVIQYFNPTCILSV